MVLVFLLYLLLFCQLMDLSGAFLNAFESP